MPIIELASSLACGLHMIFSTFFGTMYRILRDIGGHLVHSCPLLV